MAKIEMNTTEFLLRKHAAELATTLIVALVHSQPGVDRWKEWGSVYDTILARLTKNPSE